MKLEAVCILCGQTIPKPHHADSALNDGPNARWIWQSKSVCLGPYCHECAEKVTQEMKQQPTERHGKIEQTTLAQIVQPEKKQRKSILSTAGTIARWCIASPFAAVAICAYGFVFAAGMVVWLLTDSEYVLKVIGGIEIQNETKRSN